MGDSCDPHPASADTIVEFAGFGEMPAGWTAMGGTFTVENGEALRHRESSRAVDARDPAGDHYTIWAQATLASISTTALGAMGVGVRHEPGTDDLGGLCQLVGTVIGATQELRLFNTGDGGAVLFDSDTHGFEVGSTYEIYLEHEAGFLNCDANNPDVSIEALTTFDPANPELGLRVRSASRYRWVMILAN